MLDGPAPAAEGATPPGLLSLRRFVVQSRVWVAALFACAIGEAMAQTGSWLLVRVAINDGVVAHRTATLDLALVAFAAVSVAGWALQVIVTRGMARLGQEIVLGLRRELFDHLTSLSLRYFSEQRAGWIIARLTSDMDAISDVLSQG
ncbi:MAG: ABC transporter transmembrane domain-containing protein, partial [Solirubrobacteraceae bacterium]